MTRHRYADYEQHAALHGYRLLRVEGEGRNRKVVLEHPSGAVIRRSARHFITVAPLAPTRSHLSGHTVSSQPPENARRGRSATAT